MSRQNICSNNLNTQLLSIKILCRKFEEFLLTEKQTMVGPKKQGDVSTTIHITPKIEDLMPNKILKCSESGCSKEFSNIANLQMHLIRHHRREKLKNFNAADGDGVNNGENTASLKLYFCPVENCMYNEVSVENKHFVSLKYLRQHYQKVHIEKLFKCCKCEKMFPTENRKNSHEMNCNGIQKFECADCDYTYTSREALLTHAKRKNHKINIATKSKNTKILAEPESKTESAGNCMKIISIMPVMIIVKSEMKDKEVQTEATDVMCTTQVTNTVTGVTVKKPKSTKRGQRSPTKAEREQNSKRIKHVQIQTSKNKSVKVHSTEVKQQPSEILSSAPTTSEISNTGSKTEKKFFDLNLYDSAESNHITTIAAAEDNCENLNNLRYVEDTVNTSNCFDNLVNSAGFCNIDTQTEFSDEFLNQMLYSNMHTQTCDEFLSELGLTDIQTQTNWSGIATAEIEYDQQHYHNKHDAATSGPHDEFLVSTETQTSFTQCLLECTKDCSTSNGSGNGNDNGGNSVGLVNGITQHTQTCDTLLEGLFGGQENDLIANFQSTHTQT